MRRLLFIFAGLWIAAAGSRAAPALGYEVYAKPGDQFGTAQFKMWVPDGHTKISGILVLMPGSNGYVLELANDAKWQKVASDWNFALLTVYFTGAISPDGSPAGDSDYWWSSDGGDALLDAVRQLSQETHHPELAGAPFALIGRSAGALFDYHFAVRHPDRILAFVPIKGADNMLDPTPALREVPALWLVGEKDGHKQFIKKAKELFTANRLRGAPWCYALEIGAGHETGKTLQLALPYLHGMIGQRLDATGKLVPVDQSRGYLGDLVTEKAVPYTAYKGNPKEAAWLPDAASAKVWSVRSWTITITARRPRPMETQHPPIGTWERCRSTARFSRSESR
jgi:poly(3-hydroxybutyrate) depolymerase